MPQDEPAASASPCRQICRLSDEGELCVGCGRTLDEIARWSVMSPTERAEVARSAAARLPREAEPRE